MLAQLCTILHNKLVLIGSKVIFMRSPADLWAKVRTRDHDTSKQRARNVRLASADVCGRGRLRDKPKECLRGRLHGNDVSKSFLFLKSSQRAVLISAVCHLIKKLNGIN